MGNFRTRFAHCSCGHDFEGVGCFGRGLEHAKMASSQGHYEQHELFKYDNGEWINESGYGRTIAAKTGWEPDGPHFPKYYQPPAIGFDAGCLDCKDTTWTGKGCFKLAELHGAANLHSVFKVRTEPRSGPVVRLVHPSIP